MADNPYAAFDAFLKRPVFGARAAKAPPGAAEEASRLAKLHGELDGDVEDAAVDGALNPASPLHPDYPGDQRRARAAHEAFGELAEMSAETRFKHQTASLRAVPVDQRFGESREQALSRELDELQKHMNAPEFEYANTETRQASLDRSMDLAEALQQDRRDRAGGGPEAGR